MNYMDIQRTWNSQNNFKKRTKLEDWSYLISGLGEGGETEARGKEKEEEGEEERTRWKRGEGEEEEKEEEVREGGTPKLDLHIFGWFSTKVPSQFNGKCAIFSTNDARNIAIYLNMNLNP